MTARQPQPMREPAPERLHIARCLGRERELLALEGLYGEVLASGRGRVAWLTGPAGIGKSRLTAEAKRRLLARGVCVLEGSCRSSARAHQPLLEIVEAAVRALTELGASAVAAQGLDAAAALKGRLMIPAAGDTGAVPSDLRRVALFERVADFLAAASAALPMTIVLHDLHAADGATRALVAHLAQTRCGAPELAPAADDSIRALFIISSRDAEADWLAGVSAAQIALGGLDSDGIREFLQTPEVIEFFAQATGGRPRSLEAILEARPADADDLFQALLSGFTPEATRLLRGLAIYGQPAGPEVLRRLGSPAEDELSRAIAELVAARVLAKVVADGELRIGFARSADEEATWASIEGAERARLHAIVGRLLLERGDESDLVTAAEHLVQGGDGELAVETSLVAGERLELTFAYDRAIALYTAAHALARHDELRAEFERRTVELKRLTGDYAGALDYAERLRQRAPDDPAAHRRLGQLHLLRDEFPAAAAALARARALADLNADTLEAARITAACAEVGFLGGRHAEAQQECDRGLLALADEAGAEPSRLRLELRNTLGKVHLAEGEYERAAALFADNLDEARALHVPYEETRALINQGIAHLRLGDDSLASQCYQQALKVASASGDHRHRAFCLQNLGVLAHWRSDYATALRYFQDAVAAFKKIGQRGRLAWLGLDLASLYLDLGDSAKAEALAQLVDRLADGDAAAAVAINRQVIGGRIAALTGDREAARRRYAAARDLARRADNRERLAEATLLLARLELEAGDAGAARRLSAELAPSHDDRAGSGQTTRARHLLLRGEIATAQGDPGCRGLLQQAVELFQKVGDLDGEWRSQFALAGAAERDGDREEAARRLGLASAADGRLIDRVPVELRGSFAVDRTRVALTAALARRSAPPAARRLVDPPPMIDDPASRYREIVGRHPRLRQIFALLDKVAPSDSLVLVRGPSGTGKELVAEAIHRLSPRAAGPLLKVNCGALVESLLLSELFGHERGAFTGALQRKKGRFEAAAGGTLFLDEIGDVSARTQVALLRVLQDRQFERIGSTTPIKVDVRILCATHRNLEEMVARGEFREDLYYRLKGIQIDLPSLRERIEDLPLLAEAFLGRVAEERRAPRKRLSPEAAALLGRYAWPGNIRELENVIRSVSLFCDGEVIGVDDFADYTAIAREPPPSAPQVETRGTATPARGTQSGDTMWGRMSAEGIGLRELQQQIERECIARALAEADGNITRAAELLKMKRPRLSQLIKEYGIAPWA